MKKNTIYSIFLMLLMTVSCSNKYEFRTKKKYNGIHKEFIPYVTDFKHASKGIVKNKDLKGFSMGFRDYKKGLNIVGTCHYSSNEVDISKDWWEKNTNQLDRMAIIYHELGHCVLKRHHTYKPKKDGFGSWIERFGFDIGIFSQKPHLYDGCPASLMHPYLFGSYCFNKHYIYYIDELFNHYQNANKSVDSRSNKDHVENTCAKPKVENKTTTWTDLDKQTFNRASLKCISMYDSCLKTFIKKAELQYLAICE